MDRRPLYAQVEAVLASRIGETLQVGDRLPTEDALVTEFGVSRITVRRAIQNLVARGLVAVYQGRGSFVAAPRIEQSLSALTGFVEDMEAIGQRASARVLGVSTPAADRQVAQALDLPHLSTVTMIERVRLADGRPVSFDRTFLPPELGRKVAGHDLADEPIFSILEDSYGVPLLEATYRMAAVAAEETVAAGLEVEVGAPIFRVERTSYTTGMRPVDFELLFYRGDAITFTTRLQRRPGTPERDR